MKKKILITLITSYGLFIVYANLRTENPSRDLKPICLKTYTFASLSNEDAKVLRSNLMSNVNITAVSTNAEKDLVGVSYQYEELSAKDFLNMVSMNNTFTVSEKDFKKDNRPGCPVGGLMETWEKLLKFHRFH